MDTDRFVNWVTAKGWRTVAFAVLFVILVLLLYGLIGGYRPQADGQSGTVIVALHPGHGSGPVMCDAIDWRGRGYPVLCPTGQGRQWNSGWALSDSTRDDVQFLMNLTEGYDRILVYGWSQGGMMASRWACEDPRVVRVVIKSGALPRGVDCPNVGAAVYRWHGERDGIVPVAGNGYFLSLEEERVLRGGRHDREQWVTAQGLGVWQVTGGGFRSRVAPWGHRGAPDGLHEWAFLWLTRGET